LTSAQSTDDAASRDWSTFQPQRLTSANQLTTLPAEIGQLSNLSVLDLSGNQLTTLPAEIGQLSNLSSLTSAAIN
jgi:hypothetical protein